MIPSYFKIEILAIQDEFVLLGHKGLRLMSTIEAKTDTYNLEHITLL